jgi:hypothetical protein
VSRRNLLPYLYKPTRSAKPNNAQVTDSTIRLENRIDLHKDAHGASDRNNEQQGGPANKTDAGQDTQGRAAKSRKQQEAAEIQRIGRDDDREFGDQSAQVVGVSLYYIKPQGRRRRLRRRLGRRKIGRYGTVA